MQKIAIRLKTIEEKDKLMEIYKTLGFKWQSTNFEPDNWDAITRETLDPENRPNVIPLMGDVKMFLYEEDMWHKFGENTCVSFEKEFSYGVEIDFIDHDFIDYDYFIEHMDEYIDKEKYLDKKIANDKKIVNDKKIANDKKEEIKERYKAIMRSEKKPDMNDVVMYHLRTLTETFRDEGLDIIGTYDPSLEGYVVAISIENNLHSFFNIRSHDDYLCHIESRMPDMEDNFLCVNEQAIIEAFCKLLKHFTDKYK